MTNRTDKVVSITNHKRRKLGHRPVASNDARIAAALPAPAIARSDDSPSWAGSPLHAVFGLRSAEFDPSNDRAALASDMPRADVILQAGALPYRRAKDGEPHVLMVSKKRSKQWGIPKGKVKPHLSFSENAAREAYEEAGVKGKVSLNAVAMFRATKRVPKTRGHQLIEVCVYLLEVTEHLATWPEKGQRKIRWVPCSVAATRLREPALAELCDELLAASLASEIEG